MNSEQAAINQPIVIAELTIFPTGVGTSVGEYVRQAYTAMQTVNDVALEPTAMGTIIEAPDLAKIWEVVQVARDALLQAGAQRIYTVLKIDERFDKPHSAKYKVARMTGNQAS